MSQPSRPRLGRGLSSLIRSSVDVEPPPRQYEPVGPAAAETPSANAATMSAPAQAPPVPAAATSPDPDGQGQSIVMLQMEQIRPNPYQPRRSFAPGALEELAASIRTHGLLQPVLVAPADGDGAAGSYYLVAGERRFRAAQLAGIGQMPCIVRPRQRQEMLELALIENIHRADLNAVDRASAYRQLMDQFGLTQQQVADRIGEPRATVANYLRMLDLCDEVQGMVTGGSLSFGHAKVLAALAGNVEAQTVLARRVVQENLSVRALEELVKRVQQGRPISPSQAPRAAQSPYLADAERQLTQSVGTRVFIQPGRRKHAGHIVIDYYSLDDFDRILGLLGCKIES